MPTTPQLPFAFPHQPSYLAADFLRAASNEAAVAWLDRTADWPGGQLALWGDAGCGKTHLLHVWASRSGSSVLTGGSIQALSEPDGRAGLAIDDAHCAPEQPLLHLLNAAREAARPVLLAALLPPARWGVRLPDLASRLRAITAVEILPPEDSLLRALLARLLAERQLIMPAALQDWLLLRLPRSPGVLREAVMRLDRATLAAGSRVTRPLAATALADLLTGDDTESQHN